VFFFFFFTECYLIVVERLFTCNRVVQKIHNAYRSMMVENKTITNIVGTTIE